jgi:hypothetical protein
MLGLSGTLTFGRSGTGTSDYREPKSRAKPQNCWRGAAGNLANKESSGFLLTDERLRTGWRSGSPPGAACRDHRDSPLTHVTLYWQQGVREDWLRFGKPVAYRIVDRRRRVESYAAGQVFALVRWAAGGFGTIHSTLDIVRAVGGNEPYTTLPQVDPGGEVLLSARSWHKVRRVFALIDAIEQAGTDPCEVAPDHWRHMHNRLAADMRPRAYQPGRHRAWLRRRRLQP